MSNRPVYAPVLCTCVYTVYTRPARRRTERCDVYSRAFRLTGPSNTAISENHNYRFVFFKNEFCPSSSDVHTIAPHAVQHNGVITYIYRTRNRAVSSCRVLLQYLCPITIIRRSESVIILYTASYYNTVRTSKDGASSTPTGRPVMGVRRFVSNGFNRPRETKL